MAGYWRNETGRLQRDDRASNLVEKSFGRVSDEQACHAGPSNRPHDEEVDALLRYDIRDDVSRSALAKMHRPVHRSAVLAEEQVKGLTMPQSLGLDQLIDLSLDRMEGLATTPKTVSWARLR